MEPSQHPSQPNPLTQGQSQPWVPTDGIPPAYAQGQYTPAWQPLPPSPRSNKTFYIVLGSIAAFIVLLVIASTMFYAHMVNKEKNTIAKMHAITDRIVPGSDWEENYARDPKVDPFCIPSNVACHRMERSWNLSSPVTQEEIAEQLGMNFKERKYNGCLVSEEDGLRTEICASDGDTPQLNIRIQD